MEAVHLIEMKYEPGLGDTDETDTELRIYFTYQRGYPQRNPNLTSPGEPGMPAVVELDHIEALLDGQWVATTQFDEWAIRFLDCRGYDLACDIAEGY